MKMITVNRVFGNDNKTLSECFLTEKKGKAVTELMRFKGIELPWKENQRGKSCIPPGSYKARAVRRASNARYALWILEVPGRSEIMIHTANFARQLLGCLAPGREFADIDKDGIMDVTRSRDVMKELETHIPLNETIDIVFIDLWRAHGNIEL